MKCAECKELLVGYMEKVLAEAEKRAVESHLEACPPCRAELAQLIGLRDRLVTNGKDLAQTNLEDAVLDRILREQSLKLRKANKIDRQLQLWRKIMKNRITKLAAAAAIIIVALIGIHQFIGPEVVWAEVLENIRNSRTLTFLIRTSEEGPPIAKAMVIDPYLMRTEFLGEQEGAARLLGGQILIVDAEKGKGLVLNREKKKAKVCPADKTALPIYDTFRNFRDMEDFSVEQVGRRWIGDIQAVGFKLKKKEGEREIMVWADPETKLPILMEETIEDAQGRVGQYVVTDIVFDAELDPILFSVEPPDGYKIEEPEYNSVVNRVKSAVNVDRILKACRKYVAENKGQWPDSLKELTKYGIEEETFINPQRPEREVGYIYLKPPASPSEGRIVLYEAYDEWKEGINVGYAGCRVQFVRDESDFEKQLRESSQSK